MARRGEAGGELECLLGANPPEAVLALEPKVLKALVAAVEEAQQRQAEELAAALDDAQRLIPRPLRRITRKALGA